MKEYEHMVGKKELNIVMVYVAFVDYIEGFWSESRWKRFQSSERKAIDEYLWVLWKLGLVSEKK